MRAACMFSPREFAPGNDAEESLKENSTGILKESLMESLNERFGTEFKTEFE